MRPSLQRLTLVFTAIAIEQGPRDLHRIKHTIKAQTHLTDADTAVAAFWVISTWFQEPLSYFHAW